MSLRLIESIPHIHAGLVGTIAQAQETLKQAQEALRILDAADGPPWNTDDKISGFDGIDKPEKTEGNHGSTPRQSLCPCGFPNCDNSRPTPSDGVVMDQMTDGSIRDYRKPDGDDACAKCGQKNTGQTGEYPCSVCGLPTQHDEKSAGDDAAVEALAAVAEEATRQWVEAQRRPDGKLQFPTEDTIKARRLADARAILKAIRRREVPTLHVHPTEADGADSADVLTMLAEQTFECDRLRTKVAAAQAEINRLLAESMTAGKYVKEQYAAYEAKLAAEREELFKSRCRADESCAQRERLGKALCALMGMPFPPPIQDIDAMRVALSAVPAPDATASEAALLALEALRVFTPGPSVTGLPQDERDRLTGGGR